MSLFFSPRPNGTSLRWLPAAKTGIAPASRQALVQRPALWLALPLVFAMLLGLTQARRVYRHLRLLRPAFAQTVSGPVTVTIVQPEFGFNVLQGSTRRIFARVTGDAAPAVRWSIEGNAKLSNTMGNWVDVTVLDSGSHCALKGTSTYTVESAKRVVLRAHALKDPSASDAITITICKPDVAVQVVPFYSTLYAGQKADLQSFVWGSTNHDVTWAITSQPPHGDGALADTDQQDAAFSATVAGRYTLAATSVADRTKVNTATLFVTGHPMPYEVTPEKTMPVDCTVDPEMKGALFEVGPSQKYKTISAVPWPSLKPGTTIRIHNEDTTGASPTTYHEYLQVVTQALRNQPVRVCGVPDAQGHLPVLDGENAQGRQDTSPYAAGYAVVGVGQTGWADVYDGRWGSAMNLVVEGLAIRNARPALSYMPPTSTQPARWAQGAACLRVFRSMDVVVRGMDASNCSNGFFADFNATQGFAAIANTLYEGNHVHRTGEPGSFTFHQFYLQGWDEVVQFNVVDDYTPGAEGSNFKDRGFPDVVRYNYFGDGAARQLDFVDNEDAAPYGSFEGYLHGGAQSLHHLYPKDEYTADLLAAAVEAHHADFVYGNTLSNSTAVVPIHYSADHGTLENDRIGTLWFFNNSFYQGSSKEYKWFLFDTSAGGGGDMPEVEWPQIELYNNILWMDSPRKPYFHWNNRDTAFMTFGKNLVTEGWGSPDFENGDKSGWAYVKGSNAFQGASNRDDVRGVENLVTSTVAPFDLTSFTSTGKSWTAEAPPATAPRLPVRFSYGPAAVVRARKQPLTMGAMDAMAH